MFYYCVKLPAATAQKVHEYCVSPHIFAAMINKKKAGFLFFFIVVVLVISAFISCGQHEHANQRSLQNISSQIELGRYLFFDRRLSVNNTRSCGTCHNPEFAFTDGYKRSLGVFADLHQRNTEPLFNLASLKYFTAADSTLHSVFEQMKNPLLNDHPSEMGVKGNEEKVLQRIRDEKMYQQLFADAKQEINWVNIKTAIASFIMSIRSDNSPYDHFLKGDSDALDAGEKKGRALFFSDALHCSKCHGGPDLSTPELKDGSTTLFYFNTGLYNTDGKGSYPSYDQGLYILTKHDSDKGKFRVPTLRNLAFTAPYFHDGSAASLNEVIDMYAAGGRLSTTGTDKGNGIQNPYKHRLVSGFPISPAEKINLIRFLLTLSDSSFIHNPQYQNPFTSDETEKKY